MVLVALLTWRMHTLRRKARFAVLSWATPQESHVGLRTHHIWLLNTM